MKKFFLILLAFILLFITFILWYLYYWVKFSKPHYHSNFKMFINWEKVDFTLDKYSEDIWKCKIDSMMSPKDRVHLHENNPDTIHIHHEWVSWWHFFINNSFVFWKDYLITDQWEKYFINDKKNLIYILNWKQVENPFNRMINSQDRLLINYWDEDLDFLINNRYNEVSDNAWEYNSKYDPWTCSGTNDNSIIFLIKQLLDFNHLH